MTDSEPPIALDKFIEQSGLSAVTLWRYRRVGWLNTLNICAAGIILPEQRLHGSTCARLLANLPENPLDQIAAKKTSRRFPSASVVMEPSAEGRGRTTESPK